MKDKKMSKSARGAELLKSYIIDMDRMVYRYFRLHKELLETEEYRSAYEKSRSREIKRHTERFNDCTAEEIGEVKDLLYDLDAERIPEEIESYKDEVMDFIRLQKRVKSSYE